MKLRNSTEWHDHFLRRLVSWCCRQLDFPASRLARAQFRNRSRGCYSGHAWYQTRRIVVSIGPAGHFPARKDDRAGMDGEVIADQLEALVSITAHEVAHLKQYADQRLRRLNEDRLCERDARRQEVACLRAFRAEREALLAAWNEPPKERERPPVTTVQERRAAKAQAELQRWQRKVKLGQTKVRKLRARVRYYERALAAKRGPQ